MGREHPGKRHRTIYRCKQYYNGVLLYYLPRYQLKLAPSTDIDLRSGGHFVPPQSQVTTPWCSTSPLKLDRETSSSRSQDFALITVPLVQKYLGPLAALLAKFDFATITLLQYFGSPPDAFHGGKPLSVFVSGAQDYLIALKAMMQHRSQLVWFRWLYIAFSRYMWVNEWMEILPA